MKAALFGGSFDPVHSEHLLFVRAAIEELNLDKVIIMPSFLAPHKSGGAHASGEARLELCRLAFSGIEKAEVSDFELRQGGTSYSYLTCREFARRFPAYERFFLVGADMLENFFQWKEPDDILKNVTLVACGRGEPFPKSLSERFLSRFGKEFRTLSFVGKPVSSTFLRVALAFGKTPRELAPAVLNYIGEKGLYRYPEARALDLEKPERREHSYRVAQLAAARAPGLRIAEERAVIAAMLHDCGKYVSLSDPLLRGFRPPEDVPEPVLHQYTGAYLAEHAFGVTDGEVLDAIRYHTSGRRGMGQLEMLIYLADLLEEGRRFEGVETLRKLFWEDLNKCLYASLSMQLEYLRSTEKPIYPLTKEAFSWISAIETDKK